MKKMRIFVISLARSQDRRAKVIEKLGNLNIPFEFLDAVDGTEPNSHPYLKNYNEKKFLVNRRRKAAPGELGCYVSHLLAWEKCVELNEAIVVLEDDFELTDDFVEGLRFVEQLNVGFSFIRLEPMESNFFLASYKGANFTLVKQLKVGLCLTGYVISPDGAKALLRHGKIINTPIDLYIRHTLKHKQLIHALIPHLVYQTHGDTTIGFAIRDHREKGVVLKIKRFIYKWGYAIGGVTVNLVNAVMKN